MGWSRLNPERSLEAAARTRALRSFGHQGEIDRDGYPHDGVGIAPRCFFAGRDRHDPLWDPTERAALDAEAMTDLVDQAVDSATFDGGYQRAEGDGLDDPDVAWPRGYRRRHRPTDP